MSQDKLMVLTSDVLSSRHRIVVVGDLHGDYVSFRKIHDLFNPRQDYLIFLGD